MRICPPDQLYLLILLPHLLLISWLTGPKWHIALHFIDELQPSSLTLCRHMTSHVLQHSYPQSAALEEMKNTAQSKWFTLGLTQHIDPSKMLLHASPEGHSVLYCTAISEATGLFCYSLSLIKWLHCQDAFVLKTPISKKGKVPCQRAACARLCPLDLFSLESIFDQGAGVLLFLPYSLFHFCICINTLFIYT